eukprot:scaffold1192_cov58-Cylindrotheca_fusiformis.AAC.10
MELSVFSPPSPRSVTFDFFATAINLPFRVVHHVRIKGYTSLDSSPASIGSQPVNHRSRGDRFIRESSYPARLHHRNCLTAKATWSR